MSACAISFLSSYIKFTIFLEGKSPLQIELVIIGLKIQNSAFVKNPLF